MKKTLFLASILILFVLFAATLVNPVSARAFPEVIPLPDGFRPEGIVIGYGHTAYAGSLANGAIFVVDLRTGEGEILVDPDPIGPSILAVGLGFDARSGYLFVSGGSGGDGRIYDTATGAAVTSYNFGGGFVNDVFVTQDAAYFTDSFAPFLYKVALSAAGVPAASFTTISLGGDFVLEGGFNTNGIVATPNGNGLIIVHSTRGELYHVDPDTGTASLIDLGGQNVLTGDGLLLVGRTLYVVQNQLNKITEYRLNGDYTAATLVKTITNNNFDIPTTVDNHGASLYVVNARFGTPPGPNVAYDIVKVNR